MRILGAINLPPQRTLAIAVETVHRFLDVHLKGLPDTLLTLPSEYPSCKRADLERIRASVI